MKTNKVLKWLYGVFMFLPMLAIGVTCAYVTFNKNAKDSYSSQIVEKTELFSQATDLVEGIDYTWTWNGDITGDPCIIEYNSISIDWYDYQNNLPSHDYIGFYAYGSNRPNMLLYYYENGTRSSYYSSIYADTLPNFVFNFKSASSGNNFNGYRVIYNYFTTTKLDNAFYYAVGQFNESGFNQIDFVSFFNFLYSDTNIWVTFANTYINYTLFVSLCFFLPSVLLWFINFAYKLMDGFSNKSTRL